MGRGDGRKDSADRLMPPQAAGMSCYSVAEEITPVRADFLVELRGFKPMVIAGAGRPDRIVGPDIVVNRLPQQQKLGALESGDVKSCVTLTWTTPRRNPLSESFRRVRKNFAKDAPGTAGVSSPAPVSAASAARGQASCRTTAASRCWRPRPRRCRHGNRPRCRAGQ